MLASGSAGRADRDRDPAGSALARRTSGGIEAQRMVSEKLSAFVEAATLLDTGGSVHDVLKGYRGHVQANVRRLTA
jgi:hypothetical protein